jgi:hypothetical protein
MRVGSSSLGEFPLDSRPHRMPQRCNRAGSYRRDRLLARVATRRPIRFGGRSRLVSSFRGLPRSAIIPYAQVSRLRLAKPPPSKRRFAGEDLR